MRRAPRFASVLVGLLVTAIGLALSAPPANAATAEYQAESATLSNATVATNHTGYTGSGFVDYVNTPGGYVQWTVSAPAAGSATITFRYSNGVATNRPMDIAVNGSVVAVSKSFAPTANWDTWTTTSVTATLNAGTNTIRATAYGAEGGPNVDKIDLVTGTGGQVTASQLLAKVADCQQISSGMYKTDEDVSTATVPVCNKNGAVFWKADMDIDCDGVRTAQCNENTDCCFYPDTACQTSFNTPLDSAALPYVVVPSESSIWRYSTKGIGCGSVVAIIYNGQIEYAVVGDTGPTGIIGEASYRAASDLGINPDPSNGGTDSGVTYIVFSGSAPKVSTIENHQQAVTLGQQLAQQFLSSN